MNRFEKAVLCIGGASNPRRVAMALVEAIDEARNEGVSDVKDDPAVILIMDQLMNLMGCYSGTDAERFSKAYDAVREKMPSAFPITGD